MDIGYLFNWHRNHISTVKSLAAINLRPKIGVQDWLEVTVAQASLIFQEQAQAAFRCIILIIMCESDSMN